MEVEMTKAKRTSPTKPRRTSASKAPGGPKATTTAKVPPTGEALWSAVDAYLQETLVAEDAILKEALAASNAAGLPAINVAPNQGKLLQLLARMQGAKRILEIGTLGGYSTIWLARALPSGGSLVTLEIDAKHAAVAGENLRRAGLAHLSEIRVGRALDTLAAMVADAEEHFDLVFIDADKPSNPDYFTWALKLTLPGSVIIVDNVVRRGLVIDASSSDSAVIGVRQLNQLIAAESRVSATCVQTVGSKGHDGFTLIRVER
jgi:predicted O-methyltransferase YrrM